MTLDVWQPIAMIAVTVIGTLFTRALPFAMFGGRRETPCRCIFGARLAARHYGGFGGLLF